MHRSFISFIKQELKTYILLRTSLEVISLTEMTVSCVLLKTSSEVTFLLGVTVSFVQVACSTKNTYVKGVGTGGAYIVDTYARRAYTRDVCISSTCTKNAYIGVSFHKSACIGSIYVIEYSEIYSQSFGILKVGGARQKIRVETG